jgi:hypothetical protein
MVDVTCIYKVAALVSATAAAHSCACCWELGWALRGPQLQLQLQLWDPVLNLGGRGQNRRKGGPELALLADRFTSWRGQNRRKGGPELALLADRFTSWLLCRFRAGVRQVLLAFVALRQRVS